MGESEEYCGNRLNIFALSPNILLIIIAQSIRIHLFTIILWHFLYHIFFCFIFILLFFLCLSSFLNKMPLRTPFLFFIFLFDWCKGIIKLNTIHRRKVYLNKVGVFIELLDFSVFYILHRVTLCSYLLNTYHINKIYDGLILLKFF